MKALAFSLLIWLTGCQSNVKQDVSCEFLRLKGDKIKHPYCFVNTQNSRTNSGMGRWVQPDSVKGELRRQFNIYK